MQIAVYEDGRWDDLDDVINVINPPEFTVWTVDDALTYEQIDALVEERFKQLDQAIIACFKAIGKADVLPLTTKN